MLWMILASLAVAAQPVPDRPHRSSSGWLIADRTLEIDTGLRWAEGGRSAPALLKLRPFLPAELRVGLDLAGLDRHPGLRAETRIRLAETDRLGVAALVGSAVPLSADERWDGSVELLVSGRIDSVILQGNAGLELVGAPGGVALGGVPLAGLVAVDLTPGIRLFGELAGKAGCGRAFCDGLLDGGIAWLLTDSAVVDAGIGWDLDRGAPILQAGLSANFGVLRALGGSSRHRARRAP